MTETTPIAGFFHTRAEGEASQKALLSAGHSRDEVSFVAGGTPAGHEIPAVGPVAGTGSLSEVGTDAWIGGQTGLTASAIVMEAIAGGALPGAGPVLAVGPIGGLIGGLGLGAVAGGLVGLLRDHGISKEDAEFYADGVSHGGSPVTVQGVSDDRAKEARKILDSNGAIEVEKLAGEPADKPAVPQS